MLVLISNFTVFYPEKPTVEEIQYNLQQIFTSHILYVCCVRCDVGPMKAVARKQKPLSNLHSVVHLMKHLLKELVKDLHSEVISTVFSCFCCLPKISSPFNLC